MYLFFLNKEPIPEQVFHLFAQMVSSSSQRLMSKVRVGQSAVESLSFVRLSVVHGRQALASPGRHVSAGHTSACNPGKQGAPETGVLQKTSKDLAFTVTHGTRMDVPCFLRERHESF